MEQVRGYEKLEIYQRAHNLAIKVHQVTLNLPKYELFEEGSQVRRSSKAISSNIIEGYVLRNYKNEYIHYLYRAYAECEETKEHLKYIAECNSLKETDRKTIEALIDEYKTLGKMLNSFIEAVEKGHKSAK